MENKTKKQEEISNECDGCKKKISEEDFYCKECKQKAIKRL